MQKSLLFSLFLSLALLLALSTRAVFAQGDDQDEPMVDVQLDEEGDLARGPGEEGSDSSSGNSGENQAEGGRPPMSPEETEAAQKAQQQMIEYLLEKLSAECAEELKIVLQTPPEQQTQDQLSDSCRSQVQRKVGEYQKKLKKEQGGSDAEEGGDGNGEKAARPRRAAPTVKPSTSRKAKKAAPSGVVKFFKSFSWVFGGWSRDFTIGVQLFSVVLFPFVCLLVWMYVPYLEAEWAMTPEERQKREDARAEDALARKKKAEKAQRQGKGAEE